MTQHNEGTHAPQTEAFGQQVMHAALGQIVAVLSPLLVRLPASSQPIEALLAAYRTVGDAVGVTIRAPREQQHGAATRDPVVAIARASGLRIRRVALQELWWRDDNGPLLAFIADGHRPVALIPGRAGSYELHDPATGQCVRVSSGVAAALEPVAYTVFRPLPDRPLTPVQFLRFGLRGNGRDLGVLLATGTLVGALGAALPLITQVMIDVLIPIGARRDVLLLSGILLAIAFAVALLLVARNTAAVRIETRISFALQSALWDRLLKLPVPFFRQYSPGSLALRTMNIETIRQFLSSLTVPVLLPAIFAVFSLVLLVYYDAWLAMLALALLLVALGLTVLTGTLVFRHERRVQELLPNLSGLVIQLIQSIPKLRIAAAEPQAFGVWASKFVALQRSVLKVRQLTVAVVVFSTVFPLLCTMALFSALALRDAGQAHSTGTFLAFMALFNTLLSAMLAISVNIYKLARVGALLVQQAPLLAVTPEATMARQDPGELSGAIELSRVTFRYQPNSPDILSDVSIRAQPGQFIAIVGPSGSGKSTLMRLLLGFETPQTGAIYYDEQGLADLDLAAVRRQIGVVLQNDKLMPGTIEHNIIGLSLLTTEDAWEAAALVGLADEIRRLPLGMQTVVNEATSTFSGGQQQRLLLARAVATRPRILLFDEATSALDNRTQEVVTRSLEGLRATRIVIAHRLSTIVQADYIYVLAGGQVVQHGTYADLLHAGGTFRELVQRQQPFEYSAA